MRLCWIENEGAWKDSILEKLSASGLKVYTLEKSWYSDSLESLVERIVNEFSATDIFVINLNFVLSGYSPTEHLGVRLLKYLRLRGFNNHCVVYSFLTREQLLDSDPKNLILFSGGISYYRLPFDLSSIPFKNLSEIKSPEDLTPYFKAEFSLPDNRHFMANWWGVLQLWKVQKAVERINGKSKLEKIEPLFNHALKEMNSFEGLVARHIKKKGESNIDRELKRHLMEKEEKFGSEERTRGEMKFETARLNAEFEDMDILIEALNEVESEPPEGFWEKIISLLKGSSNPLRQKIEQIGANLEQLQNQIIKHTDYLQLIDLIKREKELIYEKQRLLIRRINRNIAKLENNVSFSSPEFSLQKVRESLKNRNPRIVFVDDQAEEGWASVIQRIIYGGDSDNFTTIVPGNDETDEQIALRIEETKKKIHVDLLILDLRLKGETGSITDPEQISGAQVLQKLQESKIGCPVLVTTASNKMWSYKKTINSGATAYWIKEGMDESYNLGNTVENYLRFVDLVYTLCFSSEIRFLYRTLLPGILSIETNDIAYWWEAKFWNEKRLSHEKTDTVSKKEVIENLYQAFHLYEEFFKLKIQQSLSPEFSSNVASIIIIQCARILEIIHKTDDSKNVTLSEKMAEQLDNDKFKYWSKLLTLRNNATHLFNADYRKTENFLELLLGYLNDEYIEVHEKYEKLINPPINGAIYESIIESKHSELDNIYFLKNPDLDLENRTLIVLNLRFSEELSNVPLNKGDKIKFKLIVNEKSIPKNYYANNAILIESAK